MASINDTAGIFTGDALDAFNRMETVVTRDGDAVGAALRLLPVMLDIIDNIQSTPDADNPSAVVESPRQP